MTREIPEYCDYHCPHADFPPADTAGICRTMAAVWCKKLSELVNKNAPCEWRCRSGPKTQKPRRAAQGKKSPRRAAP